MHRFGRSAGKTAFSLEVSPEEVSEGQPLGRLAYVLAINAVLTAVAFTLIAVSFL